MNKSWQQAANIEKGEKRHTSPSGHGKTSWARRPFSRNTLLACSFFLLCWALFRWYGGQLPYRPMRPSGTWDRRAEEVRDAFLHAYHDYERFAFPHDELLPVSNRSKDNFNGWGVSALDSLDTMVIMKLDEEYERAITHLKSLDIPNYGQSVPFFETVIRYLGGFLSAWHLTGDPLLLHRADQLGQALLPAFKTPTGFPLYSVVPSTGRGSGSWIGSGKYGLAESASCQMEYKYLAFLTGRAEYYEVAETVMDGLVGIQDPETHMWTQTVQESGKEIKLAQSHFSVGAGGDSAYEYFLKQYLLSGRSETQMLDMYLSSIRGVISNLIYVSANRSLLYVTDVHFRPSHKITHEVYPVPTHNLEHLSCFLPGLLALGAHTLTDRELPKEEREMHLRLAQGLGTTCYLAYAETTAGLGPEMINFGDKGTLWVDAYRQWTAGGEVGVAPGMDLDVKVELDNDLKGYDVRDPRWLSRPETLESVFILHRVTGDSIWRERGYEIFRAIETWSRGHVGYASVTLSDAGPSRMNEMPSYFLAETLKYLYLLFKEDDAGISLDDIVFNTEAHPLPVFQWNDMERQLYQVGMQPRKPSPSLMDIIASWEPTVNTA